MTKWVVVSLMALLTLGCAGESAESLPCADERSEPTPGEECVGQTTTDVWTELCAAATIEEDCGDDYCPKQAVIPLDVYCEHFECPQDLPDYEERFSTCDSATDEWPRCGWEREVGCGVVQYTEPNDESSFHTIAFDALDGSLLSFMYSSDSSLKKCGAFNFRVGTFSDYFHRRDPPCDDIEADTCCHQDAPHLW